MTDRKIKLVIGSLLHDIGKVITGRVVTEEITASAGMII